MRRIVFPLKLQMKRSQVADLHKTLVLIGLQIAGKEKDNERFGASTREAVRKFQVDCQLPVTGIVDEATALALNGVLADRGVLEEELIFAVRGVLRNTEGKPAVGLKVQAFDRDVSREDLLGSAVSDEAGTYCINFTESQFKRTDSEQGGPEVFIRVLDANGKKLAHSKTVSNAPIELTLDLTLPRPLVTPYVVRGRVLFSNGQSAPEHIVKAFDRNIGIDDTLLGQAATDAQGDYSITYASEKLSGKPAADLVIALFQGDKLLQESDVIFDATKETTKDFIISVIPAPEFLRLSDKIKPLLGTKISLGGLAKKQIDFLNKKTGIDTRSIDWLAESHKLAGKNETLAIFYYGLLSQNLSTDPVAVLGKSRASIQTALDRAAIFNQIPRLQPQEIDHILDTILPRLRAENLLKPAPAGQKASLGDILKTIPRSLFQSMPDDAEIKIADVVAENGINYEKLTDQLGEAEFNKTQAACIKRTLRLADITAIHLPLMQDLQQMIADDADDSLKTLAKLCRADWIDKACTYGIPAGTNQTPEAYGKQLEAAVEALHPTAILAERLNTGDLVISRPGFEKVGTFLKNNPDFGIHHTNIPVYAEKANFSGVDDRDQLLKSLLKLQRIQRLSASWDETGAILNAGIESALDIVGTGRSRIIETLSGQVAPQRVAKIYERARKAHDTSLVLMSGLLPRFSPTPIAAMGNANRVQDFSAAKTYNTTINKSDYATLQSLFGPLDNVTSDQSVLSPAAYFVDLLQFLNPKTEDGKIGHPLKVLLERRPDLVDLQLSSANTKIELPHIDLVLEILENAVALPVRCDLTARTDVNSALSINQLPEEITKQLQRTSLGTIGADLNVTLEDPDQGELTDDVVNTWIVDDDQRRWSLHNLQEPSLTIQFPHLTSLGASSTKKRSSDSRITYTQSVKLSVGDTARLISEFDNPPISDDTKKAIDTLFHLKNPKSKSLTLYDYHDVKSITPHESWSIDCRLGVKVLIEPEKRQKTAKLTLQTPSGREVYGPINISGKTAAATIASLKNDSIPGILEYLLPTDLEYSTTHDTDDSWLISLTKEIRLIVSYRPARLEIKSLTYQTVGKSDDLIACPENQNPIAYEILRNPKGYEKPAFPWSLPFNLPWESVRACLDRAGVSRRRLMELTSPGQYLNHSAWAYETLGISAEEAVLIVNEAKDDAAIWNAWGLKPNSEKKFRIFDAEAGENFPKEGTEDPLEVLSKVSILIQQARISYEDMLRVIKTYFVGAYTKYEIAIVDTENSDRGPCNLIIRDKEMQSLLDSGYFDRIHRFIRLWRKLDWPIEDVDRAINALGGAAGISHAADITEPIMISLAHILKLQELLDAPVSVLISWWINMLSCTHSDEKTVYEQIFLNPLVQNPPDEALLLNPGRTSLLNPQSVQLSEKAKPISAVLGISQDDLNLALTQLKLSNAKLALDNLFELYRITGLARALGISISDYFSIVSLTGATPFSSTIALVQFCQAVQFILNSGFRVQEIAYLLQQDDSAASILDLTADKVTQMLKSIRSAVQAKLSTLEPQVRNIIANNPGGPTVRAELSPDASVTVDAAALTIGFLHEGDTLSSVTNDLDLRGQGSNGTTIEWEIPVGQTAIENNGTVHRPPIGSPDTTVTLKATIHKNEATPIEKFFTAVVLAEFSDERFVAADAATLAIGFLHQGDNLSHVTGNLILPGQGNNGTSITWSTPPGQTAVLNDGTINRPPIGSPDAVATLTAAIGMNGTKIYKSFTVVILAELSDAQAVVTDAESLVIEFSRGDNTSSVTGPLTLQASGANGTVIHWSISGSSMPDSEVIAIPQSPAPPNEPASAQFNYILAAVNRPPMGASDAYVVLTATITKNDAKPVIKCFYPQDVLAMNPLEPDCLALVLTLTDPNNAQGLNVRNVLIDVVVSQVADLFGLEAKIVRKLLTKSVPRVPLSLMATEPAILRDRSDSTQDAVAALVDLDFVKRNGVDTPDACNAMHQLQKVSFLFSRLKVKPSEVDWIDPFYGMQTLDLNKLPLIGENSTENLFVSWQKMITLFQIRDRISGMRSLLDQYVTELFKLQSSGSPLKPNPPAIPIDPLGNHPPDPQLGGSTNPKTPIDVKWSVLVALIGEGLGLPKEWDYNRIAGWLALTDLDNYRDPLMLNELLNMLIAMKKLGATLDDVILLIQDWPEPNPHLTGQDPATQAERTARALLRAKYGADSWNDIIKPISDKLRVRQRDVLVDYLIFNTNSVEYPIKNVNDIYEHYLIDTQMSPGMLTSRLVQATAAVQLFVQRSLLNLEKATLGEDDSERWKWMKNYRVWQANREVFLFPENWLYPELRDDKTETFKALESGISQGEPQDQLCKDNVLVYIDGVAEIAKIKVYGMHYDKDGTLYAVGRTPGSPYNYYWRKCESFCKEGMHWYGWERIDMDINDDHVMPFVLEGNFCIAWPIITDSSENEWEWEMGFAWSRNDKKGWSKKSITRDKDVLKIQSQNEITDPLQVISFRFEPEKSSWNSATWSVFSACQTYEIPVSHIETIEERDYGCVVPGYNYYDLSQLVSRLRQEGKNNDEIDKECDSFLKRLTRVEVKIYHRYKADKDTYFMPASGMQVSITFYSYLCNRWNRKVYEYSEEVHSYTTDDKGVCKHIVHWASFEDSRDTRVLYKVVVSISDPNAMFDLPVIYTYNIPAAAANERNIFANVFEFYSLTISWENESNALRLSPITEEKLVGTFSVSATNDIVVVQADSYQNKDYKTPNSIDSTKPYANGYLEMSGLQNPSLSLPVANRAGSQLLIFPRTPSEYGEFFVIEGAPSSCGIESSIWHYEDGSKKFFLNVKSNSWSAVVDGINRVGELRSYVYQGFDGLYVPAVQASSDGLIQFASNYGVTVQDTRWDNPNSHINDGIVFDCSYPIALYNWEIFYHVPMLIAEFFTRHQRFEDAQKWLHYVFDPTKPVDSADRSDVAPLWQFLPFRELTDGNNLQELFNILAETFKDDPERKTPSGEVNQLIAAIDDWKKNPFLPFLVARNPLRWISFEWRTIFAYLDNLIAWGDQMFRRFTRESVNEAIQYYVLAVKLLGPRPKSIKSKTQPPAQSYRDLYGKWDEFSNAWYVFSDAVSRMQMMYIVEQAETNGKKGRITPSDDLIYDHDDFEIDPYRFSAEPTITLTSLGMLYFGIPSNDKLMGYWDKVEERLNKIRNCMDIDGVKRELPLFSPRIDPLLLVRATAAGLDIDAVLADMAAPLLPYRFNLIVQKANEICAEVRSLGSALLATLEKNDAESLSLLRSGQEVALLNLITQVKQRQIDEADANIDSLNQSMAISMARYTQYQKLLGNPVSVDASGLPVLSANSSFQVAANASGEEAGLGLIQYEVDQLSSLNTANDFMITAGAFNMLSGILHIIPDQQAGTPCLSAIMGGSHLGAAASAVASLFDTMSRNASHEANKKNLFASYQRRQDEWVFQSKLALEEMKQINKQIIAAQIRLDIAKKDLDNHLKQVDNAQAVDEFMHDKYTNQELYSWMTGEISNVYFTCYQLAYDMAKRAEKAFQSELGLEDSNFIQYGYWDSLKKGLMAGERLSLDLKRMEVAYLEQNRREFEITKHVSLIQLDPLALIALKETGKCEIALPEALFDIDFPGHYFRRIKSASISIPCIVGSYTSVNCTLSLLKHSYRRSSLVGIDGYPRKTDSQGIPSDDNRFVDSVGTIQSIATSHGQNDSGMFELNFRDERYLPFEGAGAISTWRIELPAAFRQFDYDTISDVILHIRYTAREGGGLLKEKAVLELQTSVNEFIRSEGQQGMAQIFSLRHEFPTEWHRFLNPVGDAGDNSVTLGITKDRFPFLFQSPSITVGKMTAFIKVKPDFAGTHNDATLKLTFAAGNAAPTSSNHQPNDLLSLAPSIGLLRTEKAFNNAPGGWTMNAWIDDGGGPARLDPNSITDLVIVCQYTVGWAESGRK